jgi:transposase
MQRLKVQNAELAVTKIQEEIGRTNDSRYDHRLHGVLLVAKGRDCYEVADILGHSPTTIENWVNAYNDEGLDGLYDESRSGRPSRLSDQIIEELNSDLRKNPRVFGYAQNLWDGKLLSFHLAKHYNTMIGVRQAQRLFHKFGFRQRKPRPVISRSDPDSQEAFKKTHQVREEEKDRNLVS